MKETWNQQLRPWTNVYNVFRFFYKFTGKSENVLIDFHTIRFIFATEEVSHPLMVIINNTSLRHWCIGFPFSDQEVVASLPFSSIGLHDENKNIFIVVVIIISTNCSCFEVFQLFEAAKSHYNLNVYYLYYVLLWWTWSEKKDFWLHPLTVYTKESLLLHTTQLWLLGAVSEQAEIKQYWLCDSLYKG